MKFSEIRKGLRDSQEEISSLSNERKKLEERYPNEPWGIYDSDESSYDSAFGSLIPNEHLKWGGPRPWDGQISRYLQARFSDKAGKLIGLEIGGPGSNLFSDLNAYAGGKLTKRSAGVTLKDFRIAPKKKGDSEQNHEVIEADVLQSGVNSSDKSGKKAILKWLAGEKADFIIERMAGATKGLPDDPNYFFLVLKDWYEMLSPNGVMLIQLPRYESPKTNPAFYSWADEVSKRYPQNILVNCNKVHGTMRIEKLKEGALPR